MTDGISGASRKVLDSGGGLLEIGVGMYRTALFVCK